MKLCRPGPKWPGLLLCAGLSGVASSQTLKIQDVPFVAQSEALCGGASLAMVLRYWGVHGVQAEDFTSSLNREKSGIATGELKRLAEERGFQALAFAGGETEAVWHLHRGRPLIALLESGRDRNHYVLMLAWEHGRVLFHDPAVGPFRSLGEDEWRRRWKTTGEWALLVIPNRGSATVAQPDPSESLEVEPERTALGPAADLREQASAEFRLENWTKAAALASRASALDPADRLTKNLLATSLFLSGRVEAGLAAWNGNGEPRLDLIRIEGLSQSSTRVALQSLGETSGSLLTPARFRRIGRRVEDLPSVERARIGYRPLEGGIGQIDISVVERPRVSSPRSVLMRSILDGLSDRAIGLSVMALNSSGDLARMAGRWRRNRSRGELSVSSPHALSFSGAVTVAALWDEQTYSIGASPEVAIITERRKRASISLARWWTADTRLQIGVAADEWNGRGRYASLSGEIDRRLLSDHVLVQAKAAGWWSKGSHPFNALSASAAVRSRLNPDRFRLRAAVTLDVASSGSPRALWPGAGSDPSRDGLLRARSLVESGIINGEAFGPRLWNASVQLEQPVAFVGPARVTAAAFVDTAWFPGPAQPRAMFDVGVGARLRLPGWNSSLRIDVATPWGNLRPRLSAGWEKDWR